MNMYTKSTLKSKNRSCHEREYQFSGTRGSKERERAIASNTLLLLASSSSQYLAATNIIRKCSYTCACIFFSPLLLHPRPSYFSHPSPIPSSLFFLNTWNSLVDKSRIKLHFRVGIREDIQVLECRDTRKLKQTYQYPNVAKKKQ